MPSGFFALLDDITIIMDDVATLTKVATKKTAGILGDDLAVNADKASGFRAKRELHVLWAISKGSLVNKIIILPVAFLLSYFSPKAVIVILVLGGLYLAYEGTEKIYEYIIFYNNPSNKSNETTEPHNEEIVLKEEEQKIKSAIFTDFILSVEIVIIALGSVVNELLTTQILVVSAVALIATIGVYGIVALIVRMDDIGFKLIKTSTTKKDVLFYTGKFLVNALPLIIKSLAVIGTIALVLVAGGIFIHHVDFLHDFLHQLPGILRDFTIGLMAGLLCLLVIKLIKWVLLKPQKVK